MDLNVSNLRDIFWSKLNKNSYKYSCLIKEKKIGSINERLKNILDYAIKNVEYYSKIEYPSLENFPILTKNIIYNNFQKLQSSSYLGNKFLTYSGGSTGKPVPILHCSEYLDWSNASLHNYFRSYFPRTWQSSTTLEIWGSDQDLKNKRGKFFKTKVKEFFYGSYFHNCFHMDEDTIIKIIEKINRFKPYYLKGYKNALIIVAEYIHNNNINIHNPNFILPRTEVLDDYSRNLLEKVFAANVLDLYGSREVSAIAAEIPQRKKNNLYVFNENNFIEIDSNNHILITNFHNYAMPIIRFDIGDESKLILEDMDRQILGKIKGRICDYLSFKNCNVHSEYFTHKFYNSSIFEFQVKQISPNKINIKFVDFNNNLDEDFMNNFRKDLNILTKEEIIIIWQKKSFIKKTANGKFRYVIGL